MRIRGFCCGWLTMELGGLLKGASGRVRIPVPGYLVEHDGRRVVFDAGLHPAIRDDQRAHLGGLADYFDCQLAPGWRLDERLEACDVEPSAVEFVVLSHLHFDHAGGSVLLPDARLVLQRREWEAALDPEQGYRSADFDFDHDRLLVDGEHDLFGDGRAVLLPTHGHTAGHQSLRLLTDTGEVVVLCGDACYLRRTLEERLLPASAFDLEAQRSSLGLLADLQSGGARLLFGHDPDQWKGNGEPVDLAGSHLYG